MTASAGAWYRVGKVNVTNDNQSVVGVDTNWQNDVTAIAVGDIFTLDAKTWYEVVAVNSDTSITLDREYEGNTQNSANYAIVRNTSGTILTRVAGQIAVQFNQKQLFLDELRKWLNSDNATEELTDSHGVKKTLKTPAQMVRDHDNKLAEIDAIHPFPWAMRKVEFEAMREVNRRKFAADGWVYFGKHRILGDDFEKINEGLYTYKSGSNQLIAGRIQSTGNAVGKSKNDLPVVLIGGVETELVGVSGPEAYGAVIKLAPAEDGTRTYDSATGVSVTHATPALAFAAETATNKVVTDRVDMWAFKGGLREINEADPSVYKHGLKQSTASNIDGVPTSANTTMSDSYFAWYEGDTSSRGNDVNWLTATESERIAIASNPKNNIFFDDETGKFYQWTVQGLSWAGIGNGDWQYIDVQTAATLRFDINRAITDVDNGYYVGLGNGKYNHEKIGSYQKYKSDGLSGDHLLICGTVTRLNQGAYHPSYNPLGTRSFFNSDGTQSAEQSWDHPSAKIATSKAQCFDIASNGNTVGNSSPFVFSGSGYLLATNLYRKRPDGRVYDAIYASGQGGVCRDMRYSAWGLTAEDFAEQDLKIKSGEYRGREKLPFSIPIVAGASTKTTYIGFGETQPAWWDERILGGRTGGRNLGASKMFLQDAQGNKLFLHLSGYTTGADLGWYFRVTATEHEYDGEFHNIAAGDVLILQTTEEYSFSEVSVSGEYTHTEVVGDPANIILCDDLKDGWVGSWNPTIPDGSGTRFEIARPVASNTDDIVTYSNDLGASWATTTSSHDLDLVTNSVSHATVFADGGIAVYQFKTKAKMTKNAVNSEVHGNTKGLGDVFAGCYFGTGYGAGLQHSLIGKVPTSDYSNQYQTNPLTTFVLAPLSGKLNPNSTYETKHTALSLRAPNNESPAFKALNYNVVVNQQCFINYAYTQLTYDATAGDWGDDGIIHIADNQTTMPDENGHINLVGMAQCVEPLGWIRNDK
tara:strand:- start:1661 stop:4600 length:2940 start_codon:yes stop_codon:yes gene_type:complete